MNKKIFFTSSLIVLLISESQSQKIVSGTIYDAKTDLPIAYSSLILKANQSGSIGNEVGKAAKGNETEFL